MIVSAVESQSTAGPTATGTSTVITGSSDTPPPSTTARQPPIGIETAAATNPTQVCVCVKYVQLGANGYAFAVNHNGFVVFHPGLRLIQVRNPTIC